MTTAKTLEMAFAGALAVLGFSLALSVAGTNIALGALTALLAASALAGIGASWRRALRLETALLALYAAVGGLTACAGLDFWNSLQGLHKDLHKLWAFTVLTIVASRSASPRGPLALAAGFAAAAVCGIWQTSTLPGPQSDAWLRAHAFVHPVTFSEQMALAVLGSLAFLARPLGGGRAPVRGLLILLALLTGTACILGQSRGALLGLVAGFAAMCWAEPGLRRWRRWAVLAAFAGIFLMELLPTHRSLVGSLMTFGLRWSGKAANPQMERFTLWGTAWRMFLDHPWTGVGPGNYLKQFGSYFHGTVGGQNAWGSAHDLFLHQLAERGLIGLLALSALLYTLAAGALRAGRDGRSPWSLWSCGAFIAFLAMNLTEVAFQNELLTTLVLFIWVHGAAGPQAPPNFPERRRRAALACVRSSPSG